VKRLAVRAPDQAVTRRGPPLRAAFDANQAPTRAATAFAESCGVALAALGRESDAKGVEYLSFSGLKAGAEARAALPAIVQTALGALPIPKRMRWGAGDAEFVRPVHWLVMLLGRETIECRLLDTAAGQLTRGHRFMSPKPIRLSTPAGYETSLLKRGKVVASFSARRQRIREQVVNSATALGGAAVLDEALLDEVTALVEWPVAITGRFDERFLQLPREVLISTLQDHQRYFPVQSSAGTLLPHFITVSNIESRDPDVVRAGNERVVRPRLSDAAFFYAQDRKQPLTASRAGLDAVTFQAKLGSIGDKVRRVAALARQIAVEILPTVGGEAALAQQAAELCKCDLLSSMVGEFPELQGIMGRYYALADGLPAECAEAIREHYLPRGAGDALPATPAGIAVALADKIDTLAGIFAIGQKPTGTRDPFALRRAAIGVLRILLERRLPLALRAMIEIAISMQPAQQPPIDAARCAGEVYGYVIERLRAQYLDASSASSSALTGDAACTTEMFDAVLQSSPITIPDFDARIRALARFVQLPAATSLAAANKRSANILRKSTQAAAATVNQGLLFAPAEQALQRSLAALRPTVEAAVGAGQYEQAFNSLATLKPEVDAFFDQVLVNDPDESLRNNRLALLGQLRALFTSIADLSLLPG
jgi:glycyl-tRNA synthetase beta chain